MAEKTPDEITRPFAEAARANPGKLGPTVVIDEAARKNLANMLAPAIPGREERARFAESIKETMLHESSASQRTNAAMRQLNRERRRREIAIENATLGTFDEITRLNHSMVALRQAQEESDERQRRSDERQERNERTIVRLTIISVVATIIGVVLTAATVYLAVLVLERGNTAPPERPSATAGIVPADPIVLPPALFKLPR